MNVASVLITVFDINDHAPVMSSATYTVRIPEDASPGAIIATVFASDADVVSLSYSWLWSRDFKSSHVKTGACIAVDVSSYSPKLRTHRHQQGKALSCDFMGATTQRMHSEHDLLTLNPEIHSLFVIGQGK